MEQSAVELLRQQHGMRNLLLVVSSCFECTANDVN